MVDANLNRVGMSPRLRDDRAEFNLFLSVSLFDLRTVSSFSNRRHERKRFLSC
jgi:hypothetical protein